MSWYSNYITNLYKPNKEFYKEFTQEWIDFEFDDTTLEYTIEEENFPFDNNYTEYNVHIDSVADVSVNIDRVVGDYINVLFQDCEHRNYRGQKYLYNNDVWLCYDKINHLSKIAQTKLLRCNNTISWINKNNGDILTEEVFVGYEISSTNDQYSKKGNLSNRRMTLYCQYNEYTKMIRVNQRFMFNHDQCFRVEELDNYNNEAGMKEPTMIKMILSFSPMLNDRDNRELNICDYYDNFYYINIVQKEIRQEKGFSEQLNATVTCNEKIIEDAQLIWSSTDENVITIDENGVYTIVGNVGDEAKIICEIKDNNDSKSEINVTVVDVLSTTEIIQVMPIIKELRQGSSHHFECGVYLNGEKQLDIISCVGQNADENCYSLTEVEDGFILTNNKLSKTKLKLVFSTEDEDVEDYELEVKLKGII